MYTKEDKEGWVNQSSESYPKQVRKIRVEIEKRR